MFLELTNVCNFDCVFCPNDIMTREKGMMDFNLAKKIIDELVELNLSKTKIPNTGSISFHLMGEPLLHPLAAEIIKYASDQGIDTVLNTNCSLLTDEMIDTLLDYAKVKHFVLSLQTPTEESFKLRRTGVLSYNEYIQRIHSLIEKKIEKNSDATIEILVLSTRRASWFQRKVQLKEDMVVVDNVSQAKEVLAPWIDFAGQIEMKYATAPVDYNVTRLKNSDLNRYFKFDLLPGVSMVFWRAHAWGNALTKDNQKVIRARFGSCLMPGGTFAILWNGDFTICCEDYDGELVLGNVTKTSIMDIWMGEKAQRIRKNFNRYIITEPYCQLCLGGHNLPTWVFNQIGSILYGLPHKHKWLRKTRKITRIFT